MSSTTPGPGANRSVGLDGPGMTHVDAIANCAVIPTRLTHQYGLRYPFVGAGMGFVAHERLAAAVTNAGGLGVLGASPDPPESLPVMVDRVRRLTSGPFGVDLICAQTGFGPACTRAHIDACVRLALPLVIFHHDLPRADWVSALKAAGARVWMQVSSPELAAGAIGLGVDGLVAQGSEAGGHARGTIRLQPLLAEIRHNWPDRLLLGAGGICDGASAAAALRAGADGVWVGTRLVAAHEANAHPEYQRRLVESDGATLRTNVFGAEWPDQPYRLLATPAIRSADAGRPIGTSPPVATIGRTRLFPHSANQAYDLPPNSTLPPTRETTGDWDAMVYPAGDGVGAVRSVTSARDIVTSMMGDAQRILNGDS